MKKINNFLINGYGQPWLKTILAAIGVAAIVFLSLVCTKTGACASDFHNKDIKPDNTAYILRDSVRVLNDSIENVKTELVAEVDSYIKTVSKKSRMTGLAIVDKCAEHNFDISLLMAQAHQETHFGAAGKSNNVFGIRNKRYSHPDFAVEDYITLMKSKYIINRTPEELIRSNFSMENNQKAKYAGHESYGKVIEKHREKIMNQTEIHNLFEKYRELILKRFILEEQLQRHLRKFKIVSDTALKILA